MIIFACPDCGNTLTVEDEEAGKRAACPHCQKSVWVPCPGLATTTVASAPPLLQMPSAESAHAPSSAETCAAQLEFLAPAEQPDELGRLANYRVLKILGAGGMGIVLLADDPLLKRPVALKVMRPEVAAHPTARQRFLREAQATAAIDHHSIIHIYQVGDDRGVPFIAMPLLKGETLDARLKRDKRLSVVDAVRIGKQIAEGLAVAHKHGLIHRDIKPANIWLSNDDEVDGGLGPTAVTVKLVDFGLARAAAGDDVQLTKTGAIVGTPAYLVRGHAVGSGGKPSDRLPKHRQRTLTDV